MLFPNELIFNIYKFADLETRININKAFNWSNKIVKFLDSIGTLSKATNSSFNWKKFNLKLKIIINLLCLI